MELQTTKKEKKIKTYEKYCNRCNDGNEYAHQADHSPMCLCVQHGHNYDWKAVTKVCGYDHHSSDFRMAISKIKIHFSFCWFKSMVFFIEYLQFESNLNYLYSNFLRFESFEWINTQIMYRCFTLQVFQIRHIRILLNSPNFADVIDDRALGKTSANSQ